MQSFDHAALHLQHTLAGVLRQVERANHRRGPRDGRRIGREGGVGGLDLAAGGSGSCRRSRRPRPGRTGAPSPSASAISLNTPSRIASPCARAAITAQRQRPSAAASRPTVRTQRISLARSLVPITQASTAHVDRLPRPICVQARTAPRRSRSSPRAGSGRPPRPAVDRLLVGAEHLGASTASGRALAAAARSSAPRGCRGRSRGSPPRAGRSRRPSPPRSAWPGPRPWRRARRRPPGPGSPRRTAATRAFSIAARVGRRACRGRCGADVRTVHGFRLLAPWRYPCLNRLGCAHGHATDPLRRRRPERAGQRACPLLAWTR